VIDVPDEEARRLVESGQAVYVEHETHADAPSVQTATSPHGSGQKRYRKKKRKH
jgi:hypothetical protein